MNKPFFSGGPRFSGGGPQRDTLAEARASLQLRLDDGLTCPCCGQFAKRYRRNFNSGMAQSLIRFYRRGEQSKFNWVHVRQVPAHSREEGKIAHWGMLEDSGEVRVDGGRAGWWRVTSKGERFIIDGLRIPKHAIIYDRVCLRLDDTEMVTIQECLGDTFDLTDLMRA